jgi:hypothetical protein
MYRAADTQDRTNERRVLRLPEIENNQEGLEYDRRESFPTKEVEHHEISPRRTCKSRREMNGEYLNLDTRCADINGCVTCAAVANAMEMETFGFSFANSEIVWFWESARRTIKFINMEVEEKIDLLMKFMAGHEAECKELGRCGAVRLSRREAQWLYHSEQKFHHYYVHLVISREYYGTDIGPAGECGLGYVVYKNMRNAELAKALDQISTDQETKSLTAAGKADIVNGIMALGFLYQYVEFRRTNMMEGIMELVTYLETKLKTLDAETARLEA